MAIGAHPYGDFFTVKATAQLREARHCTHDATRNGNDARIIRFVKYCLTTFEEEDLPAYCKTRAVLSHAKPPDDRASSSSRHFPTFRAPSIARIARQHICTHRSTSLQVHISSSSTSARVLQHISGQVAHWLRFAACSLSRLSRTRHSHRKAQRSPRQMHTG